MTERIQRRREKGWRMPPNTVYVGRPTRWGNPFEATVWGPKVAVAAFAAFAVPVGSRAFERWIAPLRGKNLACWCQLEDGHGNRVPCHADVLLELANR